jgi:hypothetical protein
MSSEPRLKTEIWAAALVRRAMAGGGFAAIAAKGDPDAGAVLVKVASLDRRARLYTARMDMSGARVWLDLSAGPLGDGEAAIDAEIARQRSRDADLWVVEIEDRAGRHFLTEAVDGG